MINRQWSTSEKIILTIFLAILFFCLFGCSSDKIIDYPATAPLTGDADVAHARSLYPVYNEQYFGKHLPSEIQINFDLGGENIAETECLKEDGTNCTISFNPHFAAAGRTADITLLHEMCHIKTWKTHLLKDKPVFMGTQTYYHDKSWRGCMLAVDTQGAFRQIIIDYYDGDKP